MPEGVRSGAADQAGPVDIERLRQRVSGYFTAVRSGQLDRADRFILPSSRDTTTSRRSQRSRITGFSLVEVKLEEGNRSAVAEVRLEVMGAFMGGKLAVKKKFRWKKESGEWFFDPADPPKSNSEIFREYYFDKQSARANPKPGKLPRL